MEIIKSNIGTVHAPNNGGLAIYVDSLTGEIMLKDIRGVVEPLTNYIKANTDESGDTCFYLIQDKNSLKPIEGKNVIDGENSAILSGDYNVNRGDFSILVGGESNTTSNKNTFLGGGKGNTVDADFGVLVGGSGNTVNGKFSSVLAGEDNNIQKHTNTHIIGSNVIADRDNTTFVENLSIIKIPTSSKGLPKNSIWNNKGVLNIVE